MSAPAPDLAARLVRAGILDRSSAELARGEAERAGVALVVSLVDQALVPEEAVLRVLEGVAPRAAAADLEADTDAVREVPLDLAERRRVVPLQLELGERRLLRVAMADPLDLHTVAEIEGQSGAIVEPLLAASAEVCAAIERAYRGLVTKVMHRTRPEPVAAPRPTPSPPPSTARRPFGAIEEDRGTPRPGGRVRTQPVHALEQEATLDQRIRALIDALVERGLLAEDEYQEALRQLLKRDRG